MAAITDLSTASAAVATDYTVLNQSGTDRKVTVSNLVSPSGTWTPSLRFGGADTGLTYTARYGAYFKLGALIIVFAQIELSNKGSSTGAATVIGLPVASIATSNFYVPVYLQAYAVTGGFLEGNIAPGAQIISLYSIASGTRAALTHAEFINTSVCQIVAIYQQA